MARRFSGVAELADRVGGCDYRVGGRLIGIDRDETAIRRAGERLAAFEDRVTLVHGNFSEAAQILDRLGVEAVDGMLFDLGVSSPQLDETQRGFIMEAADEYERTSDKTVLEAALSALDQASREVIVLYYYEEMSVREVAKTLGLLEGTVKSRLYFARRKMKKILQEGVRREK